MRETLHQLDVHQLVHQLGMALALPLAVIAVWSVRGNAAGVQATQTASAYRAELAPLPLPTPRRLRAPRDEGYALGVQRHPEDPIARRRRALLPDPGTPQPVELALEAGSEQARVVAPSLRDLQPGPWAATGAPTLAARDALPIVSTPIFDASRAAAARVRTGAPASDGGAAVQAAEPDPKAEVAGGATPDSKKAAPAQAGSKSVRSGNSAPVVKIASASSVPLRIPAKPSAETPAPVVPAVRASAIPQSERESGRMSSSPISQSEAFTRPPHRVVQASRWIGFQARVRGGFARPLEAQRRTSAASTTAGGKSLQPQLPSPRIASATRAASDPMDLSLDGDEWGDSLLDALLPAASEKALPAPWLAATGSIAEVIGSSAATAPPYASGLRAAVARGLRGVAGRG